MRKAIVKLSSHQDSPVGRALYRFYYCDHDLLALAPNRKGNPHEGGEHTLVISGEPGECSAFIEMMIEAYPQITEQLNYVLEQLTYGQTNINIKYFMRRAA